MPRIKLSQALKDAIIALPEKEKNKLLLRLIPSNARLVDRLVFDLLESGVTQEERREDLGRKIEAELKIAGERFYSPGLLLMYLRDLSGEINRHVQATKDKYGEVSLNLVLLTEALEQCGDKLEEASNRKMHTLSDYIIKRSIKILKLIGKLHPDLHMDFLEDMALLGRLIGRSDTLMRNAIFHGLDVNWLLRGEIP